MKLVVAIALLGGLAFSAASFAQTCASPLPIGPKVGGNHPPLSGTTCGGTAGLNLGGTIYPHPSIVYSFVAQNASASLTFGADPNREMSLVANCASAPITFGAPGFPMVVAPGTLIDGTTYLVIVSSDSGLPPAPPICGPYNVVITGTLPVSLQNFSVE